MAESLPKPRPQWTAWPATADDNIPMARVRLDVGQHAFSAGMQYDPDDQDAFGEAVGTLIKAITQHATERRWI